MFPIVQVTEPADAPEQLGTKRKYWYEADDGRSMLFKAEERGYGEDWAEKVVCELAGLLGVPRVQYELAFDATAEIPGVISAQMLLSGQTLVHGNTMLHAIDPGYPKSRMRVAAHSVDAIARAVGMMNAPEARWTEAAPRDLKRGDEFFCGYLMLDAWVANQDRHHENWAAIWTGECLCLAPSYDHGSALARNVSDVEKKERLETNDPGYSVDRFAGRARSRVFRTATDGRPMKATEVFEAFSALLPNAATVWKDRLRLVDESAIEGVLRNVPPQRLSVISREFSLRLLLENRRRILDGAGMQP